MEEEFRMVPFKSEAEGTREAWRKPSRASPRVARLTWLLTLLLPATVAAQVRPDFDQQRLGEFFVLLRGGTIIDGSGGLPRENNSVLIRDGVIAQVGPEEAISVPDDARIVDIGGKYLLPGFIDVHAYTRDTATVEALLAAGITAVRNPASPIVDGVDFRQLVNSGHIHGPRVFSSGPVIDYPPGYWPGAVLVKSEDEMRKAVRSQAKAGFQFISLYARVPPRLVAVAAREAHREGLKVIGDLVATSWPDAARANIDYLSNIVSRSPDLLPPESRDIYQTDVSAHLAYPYYRWLELLNLEGPEVDRMVGALLMRDVMVDPDLALIESVLFCSDSTYRAEVARSRRSTVTEVKGALTADDPPLGRPGRESVSPPEPASGEDKECPADSWPGDFLERAKAAWPKALDLVKLLYSQGVRLVAGSGAPFGKFPPGASFHRELELLSAAGIPNRDVIRIATSNGAFAVGDLPKTGSIEADKRADLVLLRSNPLEDIRNTRDIEWVMLKGKVFKPVPSP